jgi:hypothetical protein
MHQDAVRLAGSPVTGYPVEKGFFRFELANGPTGLTGNLFQNEHFEETWMQF